MRALSFRWKAIVGIAAIEAVALTVTIASALGHMEQAQERLLRESAQTALTLFSAASSDALLASDLAKLEAVSADLVAARRAVFVRVFDADGRPIVARGKEADLQQPFRPDTPPLNPDGTYQVAGEIRVGNSVIGRTEIGIDNRDALREITSARQKAGLAAVIGMSLAALFSWLLGGWLASSIARLVSAAEEFSNGDFGSRAETFGGPEVESLAKSFNLMAEALAKRDAERESLLRDAETAAEEAHRASLAKSSFLAAMSHEVRTPLNGVVGLAQLIANEHGSSEVRTLSAQLLNSADQLRHVVDDILDFSKIEAGELHLETVDFTPLEVLTTCHSNFRVAAQQKGLFLKLSGTDELPSTLRGDVTRFAQIINNLVSNALKFTRQGGIEIAALIADGSTEDRCTLRVQVLDSGPGIPEARTEEVFEPFRQADSSITRRHGGTGLGLAICRRLARSMGGDIGYQPGTEGGSLFWVEIPFERVQRSAEAKSIDEKREAQGIEGMRLLVVDDNPTNLMITQRLLLRFGAEVETATNGQEALDRALSDDFDAILMDLQMPVLDGKRAAAAIINRLGKDAPTIFALTAHALSQERLECLEIGMAGYVTKPFKPTALVQLLASTRHQAGAVIGS